jgi:hypothetical protein
VRRLCPLGRPLLFKRLLVGLWLGKLRLGVWLGLRLVEWLHLRLRVVWVRVGLRVGLRVELLAELLRSGRTGVQFTNAGAAANGISVDDAIDAITPFASARRTAANDNQKFICHAVSGHDTGTGGAAVAGSEYAGGESGRSHAHVGCFRGKAGGTGAKSRG